MQSSLDRFGIALLLGSGNARHSFIAQAMSRSRSSARQPPAVRSATNCGWGGPKRSAGGRRQTCTGACSGLTSASCGQPTTPFRALSLLARRASPAVSQLLAAQWLVAEKDSVYPPGDARRLLGRDPISVETFLRQRVAA